MKHRKEEHINCVFQFYEHNKSADLILFNISDTEYECAYRWLHRHHVEEEILLYKRFDRFDGDFDIFNIHCNNYVFMRLILKSDSDETQHMTVNVLNLAYNVLWNENEIWNKDEIWNPFNESEVEDE
jgi:hypothetical protein